MLIRFAKNKRVKYLHPQFEKKTMTASIFEIQKKILGLKLGHFYSERKKV